MPPNYFPKKSACGNAPDFGAIFMSNRCTIEECFERKLFGLPRAFAEFVKEVKAGMILFLYEYEQRKLYGVFRAVSDGGMDIVPHAYRSTRKKFPAQVCFSVVWKCYPLSEPDFHDAIRENYIAKRKFNVGLSRYQVERLLYLFHSTIVRVQKSLSKKQKQVRRRHSTAMAKVYTSLDSAEDVVVESQASKIVDVPQTLNERTSHFQHSFTTGTSNLFIHTKKGSVFSRLNLEPKPSLEKNEDNSDMRESIHEIMKKLQKCHKKWEKANRKTISVVHGTGDRTLKKRSSVFSRLTIASEAQRKDFKNWNTWRHETGAKVHADGAVAGGGSGNGQKKRKLVSPIPRDELDINIEIHDRWCPEVQMQPHESSGGNEKVGSCESSTRSDKSGDHKIEFHPKDMVLSVVCPSTSDGKGEEQERDLTNVGSMLEKEIGSTVNFFNEVGLKPLKTYQRRCLKPFKTYQRRRRVCYTETAQLC